MVYLSLGTNMGDRRANLDRALELLTADQIQVVQQSSVYETAPRDVVDQPWFLNLVVECEMNYSPDELMRANFANRKRNGPRSQLSGCTSRPTAHRYRYPALRQLDHSDPATNCSTPADVGTAFHSGAAPGASSRIKRSDDRPASQVCFNCSA